jgi:glycine/D-amino acid oxidase-like deaminating enzyme
LGLSVDMQQHAPLPFHTSLCLVFPDQARLDPLAYVRGLAREVVKAGGRIFENTRAEKILEENGTPRIETSQATITADAIILAGHAPLMGMFTVEPRAMPHQSYVPLPTSAAFRTSTGFTWELRSRGTG